jgi:hypothetical protein
MSASLHLMSTQVVADTRMALPLASTKIIASRPVKIARRVVVARRAAVRTQSVASPVAKPNAPAKKGDAISAEQAKELYRDMKLGRDFEDMCAQMYYRGKMFGFVHLYSGQEAVSTGRSPHSSLFRHA